MWARRLAFLLCLFALALWAAELPWKRVWAGHNDFMQLYAGALLVGGPQLYSSDANRVIGEQLGFWMPSVQFVRLPYYAALLKPLAALPYQASYLLFQGVCMAATLAFAWKSRLRSPAVPWLLLISIPVLTSFANGQDIMIVLALSAAALDLEGTDHPWLSGFCLALCTIKFHLFLLTPLSLLMHRKWRVAASAALGVAIQMAVSFAVAGLQWPIKYVEFLKNPVLHPAPYVLPNLSGISGSNTLLEFLLIAVVGVITMYLCWRTNSFPAAFALCVFASLLVTRHSYIQDCALLLLIPMFIPAESSFVSQLGLIVLTPIPYFLVMADGPVGRITPVLLLLWFILLAADACEFLPRRRTAEPLTQAIWVPQ